MQALESGQLSPGQRLVEQEISRQMGISRGPIREAFRQLEHQGILTYEPHRGAQLTRWGPRDVEEFYNFRAVLEGYIARLVASQVRPDDLAHLEGLVTQMYEAARNKESGRLVELDAEFHRYLGSRTGSRLAYRFLLDLQARTKMFIAISKIHYSVFRNLEEVAASHEPILEALRTADPNLVELRVVEHIKEAGERLVRLMEQESDPARVGTDALVADPNAMLEATPDGSSHRASIEAGRRG